MQDLYDLFSVNVRRFLYDDLVKSEADMILLAKKYANFQYSLSATEFMSMIVGAVLAVVLAVGGMFVIPATLLSIWQLAWCAVLYFRSKLTFQASPEEDEEPQAQ